MRRELETGEGKKKRGGRAYRDVDLPKHRHPLNGVFEGYILRGGDYDGAYSLGISLLSTRHQVVMETRAN